MDSNAKTERARARACPICDKPVQARADNKAFPFCSQRCQLVDLGRWLDGDYSIPGESAGSLLDPDLE